MVRCLQEAVHAGGADRDQPQRKSKADIAKTAARLLAGGNPPLGGKQPQPIRKVPGRRDDSHCVKSDHPRILEFSLDLGERRGGIRRQVYASEAQVVRVLGDVDEGNNAGPALGRIKPVAGPGIIADVGLPAPPDVDAIQGVVEDRDPDAEQLQTHDEGQAIQKLDLGPVSVRALESLGVRNEVFKQKQADGHDAAD